MTRKLVLPCDEKKKSCQIILPWSVVALAIVVLFPTLLQCHLYDS